MGEDILLLWQSLAWASPGLCLLLWYDYSVSPSTFPSLPVGRQITQLAQAGA